MENVSSFFCLPVVKRDNGIDLLRFIALIGVIIAHCRPLEFLLQLRQFDVPLMVILAAVSFSMSNNSINKSSDSKDSASNFSTFSKYIYFIHFHIVNVNMLP